MAEQVDAIYLRVRQVAGMPGFHDGREFDCYIHPSLMAKVRQGNKVYMTIPEGAVYEIFEEYPVQWTEHEWRRVDG